MTKNSSHIKKFAYDGFFCTLVYNKNEYTVYYAGDDVIFDTIEQAKEFIDSLE